LELCAASEGWKQALARAVDFFPGGAPIFLIAEEETFAFTETARAQVWMSLRGTSVESGAGEFLVEADRR